MVYRYPGSIRPSPEGSLSIPHRARGVKISPSFSQLCILHPVVFYRTQKIGKFGNLSRLSQTVALLQPFFMIYVTYSLDREQLYSL